MTPPCRILLLLPPFSSHPMTSTLCTDSIISNAPTKLAAKDVDICVRLLRVINRDV